MTDERIYNYKIGKLLKGPWEEPVKVFSIATQRAAIENKSEGFGKLI